MAVLLLEASHARKGQSPFQQVNSILDTTESLEDLDARIKKAKEIKEELEQMDAAVKDLEKRATNKRKEMKAMKGSKDFLDDKKVCSSYASFAFSLTTFYFVFQLALLMKDREHLTKARETMNSCKFTAGDEKDKNPDEKPGPSKKCGK